MECAERGKSGERSNNGVTYLLNDPPITFTETPKPQLVVSIGFVRARNAPVPYRAFLKMLRECFRMLFVPAYVIYLADGKGFVQSWILINVLSS